MSLFKARDWWATYAGSDEEFDLGCLCVANIDNNGLQIGKEATSFIFFSFILLWYISRYSCHDMGFKVEPMSDESLEEEVLLSSFRLQKSRAKIYHVLV